MKKTQLAVIDKVTKPKPTKEEIITAMAMIKIQQLTKEREDAIKKKDALREELKKDLVAIVKAQFDTAAKEHQISRWGDGASVDLQVAEMDLPKEYKAKRRELDKISYVSVPSLAEAKRQIRIAMNGLTNPTDRVQSLLNDEAARTALEKTLKSLD
jgi:hypothetical protein